ncbi:MAG TPA: hypothetical protein VFH56_10930 [Acidimicrobiales bacterium]|nr:hypothetical protein [Acidimicrobiales bacterium]
MPEFVWALSDGKKGTPVRVSAAFAKSAGLKVVDDPNTSAKSAAKSTTGGTAASKPEEA